MPARYWSNYISVLTFSGYKKQSQNLNIVTNLEIQPGHVQKNGCMATLNKQTDYKYQKLRQLQKALFFNFLNYGEFFLKLYQQK